MLMVKQLKFFCHTNCIAGMPPLYHILCSYYAGFYKCLKRNSLETATFTECSTIFLEPTSKSLAWVNQVFFFLRLVQCNILIFHC